MSLIEVNVIGAKTAKALVEFIEYRFAGEATAVGLVAHDAMGLGGDDHGFAAGICLEEAADDLFAGARRVYVGGVKKIDAKFKRLAKQGLALFFVESPGVAARLDLAGRRRAVGHAAKADTGDFEASLAEIDVVHFFSRESSVLRATVIGRDSRGQSCRSNYAFSGDPTP